jgi:site-specific recombinase XerD
VDSEREIRALVPLAVAEGAALALAALVDEAKTYSQAVKAASTRVAYASDMRDFEMFCRSHGASSMPASPQTIVVYVVDLARRCKIATIRRRLTAISQAHKMRSLDSPTAHQMVHEVVKGIARTLGTAQDAKDALRTADMRAIVERLPNTMRGIRDSALLLIGFAGALRRSELVALRVEDLRFEAQRGVVLIIRRSKTDQEGAGQEIGIPASRAPETCPVAALQLWLERAGISEGPIFRTIEKGSTIGDIAITAHSVAMIVKRVVTGLGYDPKRYGAHSLRAGFATSVIENGASEAAMMRITRHRSVVIARKYVRSGTIWRDNAGYLLGL